MTLPAARAFLALWNGIHHPRQQAEYETWHSFEHVPERVGLPGFIEARRYRAQPQAAGLAPGYFTCYWLSSGAALATPDYQDVFTHPTPWSARMRTTLSDFFRLPCDVSGAYGQSSASQLVTLHLRGELLRLAEPLAEALQQAVAQARLVCAHWGVALPSQAYPIPNSANPPGAQPLGGIDHAARDVVVMLQGLDAASPLAEARALLRTLAPVATPASPPAAFELLCQVRQDELAHPLGQRQPPRPDLFATFLSGDTP